MLTLLLFIFPSAMQLLRTTSARPGGHVISLEFLALMDMLCAVLATGEIMTFSIHSQQVSFAFRGLSSSSFSSIMPMLYLSPISCSGRTWATWTTA